MVQVYGTEDTFWHLVYIDDSGIKFNTAAAWNNSEVGYAGITVSGARTTSLTMEAISLPRTQAGIS